MVQRHLLNLYPARTAWMLSGARRVAMTLLMMMLTMTAQTARAETINLSTVTEATVAQNGDVLTGTLANNVKISIANNATVTLRDVSINADGTWNSGNYAGITCEGNATIILAEGSENTVKGFYPYYPGIYVPSGSTLTIEGSGSLTVCSSDPSRYDAGPGIGAGYSSCGDIVIKGGTITATGAKQSAGIGGSYANGKNCGNITIKGGTINATGGDSAAGIGAGYGNRCGSIVIEGGTITATGYTGIGKGQDSGTQALSSCGNITLGWTDADNDCITASNYRVSSGSTVSIAEGQALTDGTNNYIGQLLTSQISAIAGKKLMPTAPITMTVTAENVNTTYDGQGHQITVNVSNPASGATITYCETEDGTYTSTNPTYTDAGEYVVYYKVTASGYTDYSGSATVAINPKELTATVTAGNKVYDGTTNATVNATVETGVTGESLTISGLTGMFSVINVGTGIDVTVNSENVSVVDGENTTSANYTISYPTMTTADITLKALTVTANDLTITYGDAPANNGVTYRGFVNDEDESILGGTLDYDYSYTPQNDPIGNYTITPKGLTATNYDITFAAGTLTVVPVPVKFSVVDVATREGLEGAHVQVLDSEGNVVEEWDSTTEPHEIVSLKTGEEYTVRETVAPDGYTIPTDFTLTIGTGGSITFSGTKTENGVLLVENSMTKVKISVVEMGSGQKLEDATVQVLDSEENVVAEWTSTTESHEIDGLRTGEVYTAHEIVAPDGYAIPTDFTFTIAEDGTITTTGTKTEDGVLLVQNSMTQVKISIVDIADGEELEGAHVQVIDSENNVVEEWDSTTESHVHVITGLNTGEQYTVHETVAPSGYAIPTDFTFTIDTYGRITSSGNTTTDEDGLTVLLVENERTGNLKVSCVLVSDLTADADAEFTFTVTFDDTPISGTFGGMTFSGGVATFTLKGGESATATGLPTGLNYTVSQTGIEGYRLDGESSYSGAISTTTSEVTFTYIQLVNVKVTKVWNDADNQDGYRPDGVTVNLAKNREIIDTEILSEENSWTYTWTNLDKYNGEGAIDYTVTENAVAEYTTNITKADDGTFTYTVTNSHETEETEATVELHWNDNNNQDGIRPESVTVTLSNGTEVTLNVNNNWTATVEDLPKYASGQPITYNWIVGEEGQLPDGYSTNSPSTNGTTTTFTLSHTPGETSVTANVVWSDGNNTEGFRPESVTVKLMNGEEIGSVSLNASNNWSYTWTGLPTHEGGEAITYTVTEDAVDNYSTTIEGFTITNSRTVEMTTATLNIIWLDDTNKYGVRPASLNATLSDGTNETSYTINENLLNGTYFSFIVNNLQKYINGTEIVYSLTITDEIDCYKQTGLDKNGNTTTYTMHLMTMGNCGQTGSEAALTWEYNTAEKTLYIIGSGQMMYYNSVQNGESWSNGAPWKAFANEIEHVVISDGITYVGSNTFAHCPSISSVTLPTDQQLYQIGPGAFADCTSLTNIDIPMSVNDIGDGAFAGCSSLATVSIGYGDPGTFTLGSDVFPVTATLLVPESAYENYIKEKAVNGQSEEIDNPFYGYKNKIAPATRTFFANGTSTWMTWCDVNNWTLPEGCTAYTVGGIDGSTVTLNAVTDGVIPAYTPVLLHKTGTTSVKADFSAAVEGTPGIQTATGTTGCTFYGTTTELTPAIPVDNYVEGQTYILRGDKFIKADDNEGIAANKCWLVNTATGGARQLSIVIDNESTGIEELKNGRIEELKSAGAWYSLDGRKLDGKPTKKGLYINNGKKTVISKE